MKSQHGMMRLAPALVLAAATAQAGLPRIFFSDLESGPKSGGEHDHGVYVTVYGRGFGAKQDTSYVLVGDGRAADYPVWTDSKITFQLGAAPKTGDIVLVTTGGRSNPVSFTVRPGKIFFVSPDGNDHSAGSFSSPWRSVMHAVHTIHAGDTVYLRAGSYQTADDGEGWRSCLTIGGVSGTPGAPVALVAYPGETPVMGSTTACSSAIRSKGQGESNWVIGGITLRGADEALTTWAAENWRVIGNDMSCPNGDGPAACAVQAIANHWKFLGNYVHDAGKTGASALYQGVYFTTDSNHIDLGWNTIANIHGCRGIQIHSSPQHGGGPNDPSGHDQYDIEIHDNVIHDTQCDAIILATVDPSKGPVRIYNNLIYNAGKGNTPEGSGAWSCINAQGWTLTGPVGSGVIDVFNNTMYNCGANPNPTYSGGLAGIFMTGPNPGKTLRLRNNVIYLTGSRVPYLVVADERGVACGANCGRVTGSNNLFFGAGSPPRNAVITNSLSKDPLFASVPNLDFRLRPDSPARGVGVDTGVPTDSDGIQRAGKPGWDLGAFGFVSPLIAGLH